MQHNAEELLSPQRSHPSPSITPLVFRLLLTLQPHIRALSTLTLQHLTTSTSAYVLFQLMDLLSLCPVHCLISSPGMLVAFQQRDL